MAVSLGLWKVEKNGQALKRRNITSLSPTQHLKSWPNWPASPFMSNQWCEYLRSRPIFLGCPGGQEKSPPLKLIVEAGLIPRLVEFLKTSPLFVARGSLGSDPFCFRDLGADPSQPLGKGGGIQPLTELLPSSHNCVWTGRGGSW